MSLGNLLHFGFDRLRLAAQHQIAGRPQIRRRAGNGSRTELDDREMLAIEDVRAEHALLDLRALISGGAWIFHAQRFGLDFKFDVLAGFIKRAPLRVQQMGLEWFWRLLMEPRKLWKRYLTTNSEFIWFAGREIVARRLGRASAMQSH